MLRQLAPLHPFTAISEYPKDTVTWRLRRALCWCFLPGTGPSNPSSLKRRINSCRETGVNLDNCHRLPGRSSYGLAVYGWNRQSPLQPGYNPLFDYFDKLISAIRHVIQAAQHSLEYLFHLIFYLLFMKLFR